MQSFYEQIKEYERITNQLHQAVHDSFKKRHKNPLAWKSAAKQFREYVSPCQSYIDKVYAVQNFNDSELMEFVICFLEISPICFRSGYVKEEMLRKLKHSKINEQNAKRLRNVIIDAAKNRGFREYKYYCRLAPFIANQAVIDTLLEMVKKGSRKQQSRAKRMLVVLEYKFLL